MVFDRLQWFHCYPAKLLGALAEMPPDEGYLYVIVLLRIYEVRGPLSDNVAALARRAGFTVKRTEKCLQNLLASRKLISADGLIMNPHAERFMVDQIERQNERKLNAKSAAEFRWQKGQRKQQNRHADALLTDANKEKEIDKKEKTIKKESRSRADRADRATRIPDDWKLTPEMGNYGRSRGLSHREVINEAEKFIRYWKAKGGERGRKVDWKATWENWCISSAERLGRVPRDVDGVDPTSPEKFDRKTWETIATLYESTSNWQRSWGPEPGPNCKMPPDLMRRFVNHELTGRSEVATAMHA